MEILKNVKEWSNSKKYKVKFIQKDVILKEQEGNLLSLLNWLTSDEKIKHIEIHIKD